MDYTIEKLIITSALDEAEVVDFTFWFNITKDIDGAIKIIRLEKQHRIGYAIGKGWISERLAYTDKYNKMLMEGWQ